jgi:hypothetical protein
LRAPPTRSLTCPRSPSYERMGFTVHRTAAGYRKPF